jgi:DNA-binding transcriptional LysR family regulator
MGSMSTEPFLWDDLRLVLAIAEGRGLGPAAERLHLNGSTVFRRLGQIEARLGMKLFERHRTGYLATPAGAEIVALAARMEDDVAALTLKLAGEAPSPSGEIRVTTNDTLLLHALTPIFARFRIQHPTLRLDVVLSNDALNLARRDADVAIRATDEPPENLLGRRVSSLGWAVYGRSDETAGKTDMAELTGRNWVTLGDGFESVAVARFVREHVATERIVYRVNTVVGLAGAVEAGIGIGPLPCFVADTRPGLRRLLPPNPDFATSLWILTHPHLRHTPRVRALVDFVAGELSSLKTALAGA